MAPTASATAEDLTQEPPNLIHAFHAYHSGPSPKLGGLLHRHVEAERFRDFECWGNTRPLEGA